MNYSHGGRVEQAAKDFQIPEDSIADFSASVNPYPLPDYVYSILGDEIKLLHRYPDTSYSELYQAAEVRFGIERDMIFADSGSARSIFSISAIENIKRPLIAVPNFSEYERACGTSAIFIKTNKPSFKASMKEIESNAICADALFISNPNSPSGSFYSLDDIRGISEICRKNGCRLILDEAFIEINGLENESALNLLKEGHDLIVLRSLTKTFAVAALRISLVFGQQGFISRLKEICPPWHINRFAAALATPLLQDDNYLKRSIEYIKVRKEELGAALCRASYLTHFDSAANYFLFELKDSRQSEDFYNFMGRRGILLRDASNYRGLEQGFFRCAVNNAEDNTGFIKALEAYESAL